MRGGNDMAEEKSKYVFNEALILKQLFDDLEQEQVEKISSSTQKHRQMQENIYQRARQRKKHHPQQRNQINAGSNKESFKIGFWVYGRNFEDALLDADTHSDKCKGKLKIEPLRYRTLGYNPDTSGE